MTALSGIFDQVKVQAPELAGGVRCPLLRDSSAFILFYLWTFFLNLQLAGGCHSSALMQQLEV